MISMPMQSLKLLRPTVKVEMYLRENTIFDLDLGIKVTCNIDQHPLHHVTYAHAKIEVALHPTIQAERDLQYNTVFDLDLGIQVT